MATATILLLVTACAKEIALSENTEIQKEETGTLVSSTLVSSIPTKGTLEQVKEFLIGYNKDCEDPENQISEEIYDLCDCNLLGLDFVFEVYTIKYNTIDAYGEPLVLSGDIAFVNETTGKIPRKLGAAYVFNNAFSCDDPEGDSDYSNSTMFMRKAVLPLRALYNELVIYPHNQGAGIDKGKHYFTPVEYILNARQNIDLELAALEFIKSKGVEMWKNYYTQVVGTYNGAASALAFQYLLEADPEYRKAAEKINLKGTYCAEGCYRPSKVLINIMKNRKKLRDFELIKRLPYIYTAAICGSYQSWGNEFSEDSILLEDYFSEKFNGYLVDVDKDGTPETHILDIYMAGELDLLEADKMKEWGFTLKNIINENLYKEGVLDESSKPIMALKRALEHNEIFNYKNWKPSSHILIVHAKNDELNPYYDAVKLSNTISGNGINKNVKLKTVIHKDRRSFKRLLFKDSLLKKCVAE